VAQHVDRFRRDFFDRRHSRLRVGGGVIAEFPDFKKNFGGFSFPRSYRRVFSASAVI
jgi:hypothetical protein